MARKPRILVLGFTGSGKTTAGRVIAEELHTRCTSTSTVIINDLARKRRIDPRRIRRHKNKEDIRQELFDYGRAMCKRDPAFLVRQALKRGSVVDGCRRQDELAAAAPLFDLVVWVERPGVDPGSTDGVGISPSFGMMYNNFPTARAFERYVRHWIRREMRRWRDSTYLAR